MRNLLGVIFFSLLFIFISTSKLAYAYEFPISELGNCRNYKECHLFCEVPTNKAACWSYSVYGNHTQVLGDETPEARLGEIGISFPITNLGNCTNVKECQAFCSLIENQGTCQTFANQYQPLHENRLMILAEQELGCSGVEACRSFCSQTENKTACSTFAKRYHLKTRAQDRLLQAVQQNIGCTDRETCKIACALPENQQTCSSIVQQINPNSGDTRKEELVAAAKEQLGCTSFEECKSFCQNPDNRELCRNFGSAVSSRVKEQRQNQGACGTVEECRRVCEINPAKCPDFPKTSGSPINSERPSPRPSIRPSQPPQATNSGTKPLMERTTEPTETKTRNSPTQSEVF